MNLFAVTYAAVRDLLSRLTSVRAGNLDQIDATRMAKLDALEERLGVAWAAKLDALETRLGAAWAAKIDTLETRLGAAWAAKVDATVSSRAAADTAVSTAVYTSGRAAKVDFLDAAISTRLSAIKSIRRGIVTVNNNATSGTAILSPAVDPAKTLIMLLGRAAVGSSYSYVSGEIDFRINLTNSTTITATRAATASAMNVAYQLVEFN